MTPEQFYAEFALGIEPDTTMTIRPGPIAFKVGPADALAAKMLLWLIEQIPDDATYGYLDDVLDAARFWSTFWASMNMGAKT